MQAEQLQKVSPNNSGFTIMPITNGGPNGALLDPTVPALGPGGAALDRGEAALVPEPSTIAMLFLGSGCAGAFTVLRRRRGA